MCVFSLALIALAVFCALGGHWGLALLPVAILYRGVFYNGRWMVLPMLIFGGLLFMYRQWVAGTVAILLLPWFIWRVFDPRPVMVELEQRRAEQERSPESTGIDWAEVRTWAIIVGVLALLYLMSPLSGCMTDMGDVPPP